MRSSNWTPSIVPSSDDQNVCLAVDDFGPRGRAPTAICAACLLSLSLRKTNLARLLARRPDGIFVAPYGQGEIGPDLFRAACNMGLEGLVSKRVDRPYRGGQSPDWVKVKNRKHPAMERVKDAFA